MTPAAPSQLIVSHDAIALLFADISVPAGFPSPAEDHPGQRISLDDMLNIRQNSTFLMRVSGQSMSGAGIFDADVVVVDRSRRAVHGDIVVAVLDGEFTIKRLWSRAGRIKLMAENPTYPDIIPSDSSTVQIWGTVTASIKSFVRHGGPGTAHRRPS